MKRKGKREGKRKRNGEEGERERREIENAFRRVRRISERTSNQGKKGTLKPGCSFTYETETDGRTDG